MRLVSRFIVLALSASLSGCGLFSSPADRALRNTPSFKDGYADGCAAAQQQGSDFRGNPVVDQPLYDTDKTYRAGWSNGYAACRPTDRRQETTPGSNPMPEAVPGH